MIREEMLVEIDRFRGQGNAIGITGHVGEWQCEFNAAVGKGATPVEAYLAAKALGMVPPAKKRRAKR